MSQNCLILKKESSIEAHAYVTIWICIMATITQNKDNCSLICPLTSITPPKELNTSPFCFFKVTMMGTIPLYSVYTFTFVSLQIIHPHKLISKISSLLFLIIQVNIKSGQYMNKQDLIFGCLPHYNSLFTCTHTHFCMENT